MSEMNPVFRINDTIVDEAWTMFPEVVCLQFSQDLVQSFSPFVVLSLRVIKLFSHSTSISNVISSRNPWIKFYPWANVTERTHTIIIQHNASIADDITDQELSFFAGDIQAYFQENFNVLWASISSFSLGKFWSTPPHGGEWGTLNFACYIG